VTQNISLSCGQLISNCVGDNVYFACCRVLFIKGSTQKRKLNRRVMMRFGRKYR